ncbi:Pyridoxamine 5'-phosphate oxidase [Rhizoctonia solani]|uniref:Pyridoxamine 5'-phosphate oxidase n=1 Tax=Rhizoctonia solani TaxID=456999 RepID=A0A8H7LI28_9AGAM|nr:Pyridoxamine 5'-phosphate oxidase [Rhizoctonia solani]
MFPVGRDSHELSQFLHTHSKSSIMGKFYDSIPESFIPWINEQHCFWVATAPISANGHVNVSPKGMTGTFKLLGPNACFYQDLSGSGKISPLGDSPLRRIVHELGSPRYEELIPLSDRLPGSRAAIEVQIHKVGSSCGYSVPFYEYTGERTLLCDVMRPREQRDADGSDVKLISTIATDPFAHLKPTPAYPLSEDLVPEKSLRKYWAVKNIRSIDGVPGLHLGRIFAGLPMTRDKVKDNTRFHEPVGVMGSQNSKAGVVETPARGSWAPIFVAFTLGLTIARLVGLVHHAYGLALGL